MKLLLIFFLIISFGCRKGELSVHFIDVGYGDSILIEFPSGKNMLIDGGDAAGGIKVVNYLKKIGIKNINTVIATHPGVDHIYGLVKVIDEFEVGVLLANNYISECEHYAILYKAVKEKGIEFNKIKKGDTIGPFIRVLHPETLTGDLNKDSLVIRLEYRDVSFLFTADIPPKVCNNLVIYYGENLKSNVLHLPHHGQSGSKLLFQMASPDIAVKSIGDSKWRRPLAEKKIYDMLKELQVPVLSTDIEGTIVFTTDGKEKKYGNKY